MNPTDEYPPGTDQQTERLICRCLDDQAGPEEQEQLAEVLAGDPAAQRLYDQYRRIDLLAGDALRYDLDSAQTAVSPSRFRGLGRPTAGAILTAAAVIALSFLPGLWSSDVQIAGDYVAPPPTVEQPHQLPTMSRTIDYREVGTWPSTRSQDVRRDLIGIRGRNKNVIYLFERDRHSTKLTPISGDI
jgi:hypothetical protein